MRKLLFALVVMAMGGFAFAGATPASAMSAGAVTGLSDIVRPEAATEKVAWVRRCWWRYGRRHCRSYWRPGYGFRRHYGPRRWHGRRCWWRYGRRHCRW
jgi:hypothetical protein